MTGVQTCALPILPRLARLVRQAATETGKQAELAVEGASGELDRQEIGRASCRERV